MSRYHFDNIDYKANLSEDYFDIDILMESECCNTTESSNVSNTEEEVMNSEAADEVLEETSILNLSLLRHSMSLFLTEFSVKEPLN